MAASTITRDTWVNDSGSFAAPAGDGTVLANTVLQNHIYARIDAMFAGAGAYTTFSLGGLLSVEGFGTHLFSAGGTGANTVRVRNTTAGTGNSGAVVIANDNDTVLCTLAGYSSTFTPSTYALASGSAVIAHGIGGLSLATGHPNGNIRFYGAATEWMRLNASGGFAFNSASDPGVNNFQISGLVSVPYFGSHSFSASGTGGQTVSVQNTTAGIGNYARVTVGNDVDPNLTVLQALSSTYTPATFNQASGSVLYAAGAGGLSIATNNASGVIRFYAGSGVECARFLSSGSLAINRTSAIGSGIMVSLAADSATQSGLAILNSNVANNLSYVVFYNSVSGVAGSISQTGASTVAYNTSSDARLKIDGGRAQDFSALRQLIIHDFTWKADGVHDRGVFAQEAYPLFPRAVIQGSDATTPDGTLTQPWMTDYTKFIPDVIVGWQAHDATLTDLLARVTALETPP